MSVQTPKRRKKRGRGRIMTVVGLCLILVGLGFLGYVGWEYYGTNIVSKHKQGQIKEQIRQDWSNNVDSSDNTDSTSVAKNAVGLVRIKRFGEDYEVPLIEGFDDGALAQGIGEYPKGADVGEVGNFAIAGHRVTHGEPFRDFLNLRKGDTVEIETRTDIFTYKLRDSGDSLTLPFTEGWPLQPVPEQGHAGEAPTEPVLTMVTCSELFHTDNRNVVFGDLVSTVHKDGNSNKAQDQ